MKKILLSILTIALVATVAVGATRAYFSDTETSSGNSFTAGTLDLRADNKDDPLVTHVTLINLVPNAHFTNAYAGQWVLKNVGSVPGVLSMTIQNIQNGTPTCNDPKVEALAAAGLPACVIGSSTGGRLGNLLFGVWGRNEAPWGALSSIYTPFNSMGGVQIFPSNAGFSGTLNSGDSVTARLALYWDTNTGTLDNTAQGDTLSFDIVFKLDQVH